MFTNKEAKEFLADKGLADEQLAIIFEQLELDPNAKEFDDDVIVKVEAAANEMGLILSQVKRLSAENPQVPVKTEQIEALAIQASQSLEMVGIAMDAETFFVLADTFAQQAHELAVKLGEVQRQVLRQQLVNNKNALMQELVDSQFTQGAEMAQMFTGNRIQEVVEDYSPTVEAVDWKALLAANTKRVKLLKQAADKRQQQQLEASAERETIDVSWKRLRAAVKEQRHD